MLCNEFIISLTSSVVKGVLSLARAAILSVRSIIILFTSSSLDSEEDVIFLSVGNLLEELILHGGIVAVADQMMMNNVMFMHVL